MNRKMLNMAFSRSSKEATRMAIAARILHYQDSEPWKQRLDTWSDQLNTQAAKRKADWEWVQAHPIRAFFYLGWRKMFGR